MKDIYISKSAIISILVGMVPGIIGLLLVMLGRLERIELLLGIYGVKKWWDYFINSENKYAMKLAKFFSIRTLQVMREEEEIKIEVLEEGESY